MMITGIEMNRVAQLSGAMSPRWPNFVLGIIYLWVLSMEHTSFHASCA